MHAMAYNSSCPTPRHTPIEYTSWSRLSAAGVRSRVETPLGSYVRSRLVSTPAPQLESNKVPLSVIASTVAGDGYMGGCFNATTRHKMVPLRQQYLPQLTRGIRSVRLHTQRYNPAQQETTSMIIHSDSLTNVKKEEQRQEIHYSTGQNQLEQAKERKVTNRFIPHRADRIFYMNGHSANLNKRRMFSDDELHRLQLDSISENRHLYYGRGVRIPHINRPSSKAITKLQQYLKEEGVNQESELTNNRNKIIPSRGSVSFLLPLSPSSPSEERGTLMSAVYGKRATVFVTQDTTAGQ